MDNYESRWSERGTRPVRIANCSGARGDPGYQMRRQLELGDVDFITGDYLAEMNIAENAEAFRAGTHPGYEPHALEGIRDNLDLIAEKKVKVIVNGGSLNPHALAEECCLLIRQKGHSLKVAYVSGDDLYGHMRDMIDNHNPAPTHLDAMNSDIRMVPLAQSFFSDTSSKYLVSANAYLGGRAIVAGLERDADIIICGRVADASPVIAAAWYWHSWKDTDYDKLAQSLIGGHLIECSAYTTGANYAAFYEVDTERLIDIGFPIAEIDVDGTVVICKHEKANGLVTVDTVKCQFLYELQGNLYHNSDVTAILDDAVVEEAGPDRVKVTGIRGQPPPPSTKLALFYRGGYQSQILVNACGYATDEKWALYEAQIRRGLLTKGLLDQFEVLDFQIVGIKEEDPSSQLRSTTYCRIFSQAVSKEPILELLKTFGDFGMQHFSGFHLSLDLRTALPLPYVAFYPAIISQNELSESITFVAEQGQTEETIGAGHPPLYTELIPRENYETNKPISLCAFGPMKKARLGDIVLARSGDKGSNLNIGLFVRKPAAWNWLRSFLTKQCLKELMGNDWSEEYFIERVEFQNLHAVHFVIYGCLDRGVSSSTRLDAFGKGFADYVRDRVVDVPVEILL